MPKESRPRKKKEKSKSIEVDSQAVKTLRTLNNEEAFHFYEAVSRSTGQSASSLHEFLEKVESVKLESLVFHLERKDFKNWIANTLKDPKLAQKIELISTKNKNQIKTKIRATIKAHLKELETTSIIQVEEPMTVTI
jgi:hypothetical protein